VSADNYKQVVVVRPTEHGSLVDVWWIDSTLARVGKRVRDEDKRVWTIAEVHGTRPRQSVEAWNEAGRRFQEVLG
jgi:hypothetical protein